LFGLVDLLNWAYNIKLALYKPNYYCWIGGISLIS
jgi:hypothetical protein